MGGDNPIIIQSMTNTPTEDIEKTKEIGMNEHLGKPLQINSLFKLLSLTVNL